MAADHRLGAVLRRQFGNCGQFRSGVGREVVDRYGGLDPELGQVFDVTLQVRAALPHRCDVFGGKVGLRHPAMHLERADRGDQHDGIRLEARHAALDVHELFRAQIGAEAGFGHDIVRQAQCGAGGDDRVAAVGDIGEGAAVNDRRVVLQRLDQVRQDRVFEQHGHRAVRLDVAAEHWAFVAAIADDDVAQPLFQICQVIGEAQDRHDFRGDCDVEPGFARIAVADPAQRADGLAQGAVVHVQRTAPGDPAQVKVQRVAPVDVVVDHGREQIVRRRDRVEIAGEVQVDLVHRHDLGLAAPGAAALDAKTGAQAGLAQTQHGVLADAVQCVCQTDRRRGLAFSRRGRADRGDQDQLALPLCYGQRRAVDLGLGPAIGNQRFVGYASLGRNRGDRFKLGRAGDFDVSQHGASSCLTAG